MLEVVAMSVLLAGSCATTGDPKPLSTLIEKRAAESWLARPPPNDAPARDRRGARRPPEAWL